jgi:hypothetical protein
MTFFQNEKRGCTAPTVLCLCTHRKIEKVNPPEIGCSVHLRTYKLSIDAPVRRLNLRSLKPVRASSQV